MSASAGGRRTSHEERRRLVAESLRVSNPGNNARELPVYADPRLDCQIDVAVDEIDPYEHNPRRTPNHKFEEIKESIRACGIRNPVTVTRRPGAQRFIIEAGGNTRLLAIKALWEETRDPRFEKLTVMFRPWRSEKHVLTAHLIENEQRGELTFWDKACGVAALKAQLDAEKGQVLTLRELEQELKATGMSVNTATLTHYLFATERLRILGEANLGLTGLDVKTIQPRLNVLRRYAETRSSSASADLFAAVFDPEFSRCVEHCRQGQTFNATALCDACLDALARHLDEPASELRKTLGTSVKRAGATPVRSPATERVQGHRSTANLAAVGRAGVSVDEPGIAVSHERRTNNPDAAGLPPAATESAAAREKLDACVHSFAALRAVDDCLCADPKAPRGYSMRSLSALDSQDPRKCFGWNLLAAIAGQGCEEEAAAEHYSGAAPANGAHDEFIVPSAVFPEVRKFVNWLLDPRDESSAAFCKIIEAVREMSLNSAMHTEVDAFAELRVE